MRGFVQMLFDKLSGDMADLRHGNSEIRSLDDLRNDVTELQDSHRNNDTFGTQLNDTMERQRQIEDENKKEFLKMVCIPELRGENNEQTQNKMQKLISDKLYLPSG